MKYETYVYYHYYCDQCRRPAAREADVTWFWARLKPPGSPACHDCGTKMRYVRASDSKRVVY